MPRQLGVVMDPIQKAQPENDTTLGLLLAAQTRGWTLFYFTPETIFWQHDQCMGHATPLTVNESPDDFFELGATQVIPLNELDLMLIRVDPPFDAAYLQLTLLLEQAQRAGLRVANDPRSLRDANEKCFALQFPECCPPTLISANRNDLIAFMRTHEKIVIKPLNEGAGRGVFLCHGKDPNHHALIDTATHKGTRWIVAQKYLPKIATEGDQRVLLVHGQPIEKSLRRIPAPDELRSNLAVGGHGEGSELSERARWICEQIGPTLKKMHLNFVGIDIIDDQLTEINVTSPTGMRQLDRLYDLNIGDRFFEPYEKNQALSS